MLRSLTLFGFAATVLSLAVLGGCTDSSKMLSEHRTKLLMGEEPDDIQPVLEVREALLGVEDDHDHDHGEEGHEEHAHEHDEEHGDHDEEAHDHEHAHDEEGDHDEDEDHAHDHDEEHGDHDEEAHDHEHDTSEVTLPTETIDVVLVGQIGGLTNPWKGTQPDFPFEKNQAKFFLADPGAVAEAEGSGHSHAPGEECPICAAHAKDNTELLAVVQFLDEKGNVLPIDARELFDVKAKDTVVVRGKARVTEGGILAVDATGIYIRR